MKRKKFLFNDAERAKIKASIQRAESKTSGEIVPVVARSSAHYRWVELSWSLLGWFLSSLALLIYQQFFALRELSLLEILVVQLVAVGLGFLLAHIPWIRRLTIPKKVRDHNVHQHCLASFLRLGLTETKARTGVLIYLSKLERKVEILADRGIYSKTPKGYWDDHAKKIVGGVHSGTLADQLCEVIEKIAQTLAEHFPREADDVNELGDEVQFEDPDG